MRTLLSAAVVLSASPLACADLVPVSHSREIEVSASANNLPAPSDDFESDFDVNAALGAWDRTLQVTADAAGLVAQSAMRHESNISSSGASGRFDGSTTSPMLPSLSSVSLAGSATLEYVFDVSTPTSVMFTAAGSHEPFLGVITMVSLHGPSVSLDAGLPGQLTASFSGVLEPGRYTLSAEASLDVSFESGLPGDQGGSGSYWVEFDLDVVPAPSSAALAAFGLFAMARRRRC